MDGQKSAEVVVVEPNYSAKDRTHSEAWCGISVTTEQMPRCLRA